jgi:hypothetical protein
MMTQRCFSQAKLSLRHLSSPFHLHHLTHQAEHQLDGLQRKHDSNAALVGFMLLLAALHL